MYLRGPWDAHLDGKTHGGEQVFDPCLIVTVSLKCPCCKQHVQAEAGQAFERHGGVEKPIPQGKLTQAIKSCAEMVSEQRACTNCGTISLLPDGPRKTLEEKMRAFLTLKWVDEEKARLVTEQKKVA